VTFERLTGTYLLGVEPLIVAVHDGDLVLSTLGVPPEFAARLEKDGDAFRIEGGWLHGAGLVFEDGVPCRGGVIAAALEFTRAPDDVSLPGGRGLLAPPLDLRADEAARYAALLTAIERDPDGGWLELEEPPRWRFVEWLTREERVVFHGSPRPDIEVFAPVRSSVELMDQAGTGNRAAVYGTTFGLWAMWFAVIDRSALTGSIRNGVLRWSDRGGRELDVYHFSVHHDHVGGDIWRPGTLYLLPRDTFRPNSLFPGGPAASEWASPQAVRPLKRLAVEPGDFPFLSRVGGHDDTELIHAGELSEVVLDHAVRSHRVDGGLVLTLEWDEHVAAVFDEYLETWRRFTPDVDRRLLRRDPDEAQLKIRGTLGFLQALEGALAKRDVVLD
jgi:hypothetical protein